METDSSNILKKTRFLFTALCFITGTRYKKGTVHCEFLDEDVWMRFNAEVARIKGLALPKNTAKGGRKAA